MRIQRYLTVCLSVLLLSIFAEASLGPSAQKRNLALYENGGTFDFSWDVMPEAHERMKLKLRMFLWEHWSQKRLGRVVAIFYTIEGDPTTVNLYIEPDGNGRWRVVSEYERECCALYALEKKKRKRTRERGVAIYDRVEWVEPINNGVAWRVMPEGTSHDHETYRLRFSKTAEETKSSDTAFIL
jgi:hypothetical protein